MTHSTKKKLHKHKHTSTVSLDERASVLSRVKDVMAMMDVVVHASTRPEPFGMVIIEAMALGKPMVATEGGGPSEIITDGKSGILVARENSESLSRAIIRLLENPTYATELGEEGRRVVEERFTHTRQAKVISQIYADLLNDRPQLNRMILPVVPPK